MKLNQLTFTRFLAAMGVVVLHYAAGKITLLLPWLGHSLHYLNALVSYFFLLSGFILVVASAPQGRLFSKRQFWLNRFARVYPLYLFAFLLTAGAVATVGEQKFLYEAGSFTKPALASVLLVQAWIPQYAFYLNYPSWSLSVEALFYLLFPFLFYILINVRTSYLILLASSVWGANQGLHVYLREAAVDGRFTNAFPAFHIATFLMGVCTGILFIRHKQTLGHRKCRINIGLVTLAVLYGLLLTTKSAVGRHFEAGLFAPLFAILILALSVQQSRLTNILSTPRLVYLGEISYGIYILQAPVAVLVHYVDATYLHLNAVGGFLLLIIVLISVAAVCYEWIEKPSRNALKRLFATRYIQSNQIDLAS